MKYVVLKTFNAPNEKSARRGSLEYKEFREGDIVEGEPYSVDDIGGIPMTGSILVSKKYLIPSEYVRTVDDIVQNNRGSIDKTAPIMARSRKIRKDTDGYVRGAVFGLVVGAGSAIYFKKSWWIWGGIGFLVGGLVAKQVSEATADSKKIIVKRKKNE